MKNNNPVRKRSQTRPVVILGVLAVVISLGLLSVTISGASTGAKSLLPAQAASGWTQLIDETFESPLGSEWNIYDVNGSTNGEYYWARTANRANGGSYSVWATGGGAQGELLNPGTDPYPNSAVAMMVHDPVNLSGQESARLNFDIWYKTQPTFDLLEVAVSTDGSTFTKVATYSGDSGGWKTKTIDLSAFVGEPAVTLRFFFSSNAAVTNQGVFLDNVRLEGFTSVNIMLPLVRLDPPPTPKPPEFFYFDDFSDPESGWPRIDHTGDPQDCWKWYYSDVETYRNDICDDRTDVKVSPLVELPNEDYVVEAKGRFRQNYGMWWTAYGIMFDAKDEPDPNKPDLGDYYMLWVLWEGKDKHKWKILRDVPGEQEDVTPWRILDGRYYNYGDGTEFNKWRIERTDYRIRVYVNDHLLDDVGEQRPTTNNQILFGVYSSTYETSVNTVGFDDYLVDYLNADVRPDQPYWSWNEPSSGTVRSGDFELEHLLPNAANDPDYRE